MLSEASTELRSDRPSMMMRLGNLVVRLGPEIFPRNADAVRAFLANRKPPKRPPPPGPYETRYAIERFVVEGQECVTLHPRSGPSERHILYFHGGGFVLPPVRQHWQLLAALVETTGVSATAALYDLVPEAPARNADRLADAVFARLCETRHSQNIALAGDSAGAHIALSLALRRVRGGGPQPGRLALFAPWLDVAMRDRRMETIEPRDHILKIAPLRELGAVWAEDRDPAGPECSPLYTPAETLAQLPPTRIWTGRHDLFIVDSRTFTARLHAAGVDAKLYEYEGAPHVFMALVATREAKDVFGLMREFLSA